jgi:hypothetical protein
VSSSKLTPTRIKRALKHRLKNLVKSSQAKRPVAALTFGSPLELRNFACTPANSERVDVRFAFVVSLPSGYVLPTGPQLRIAHVTRFSMSYDASKLSLDVSFSEKKSAAAVAWAVATLISPSLAPTSHFGPDVVPTDAALVAGQRLHFGAFAGSDASAMEAEHARHITTSDRENVYFDLAQFNPVGLRLREKMESLPRRTVTAAELASIAPHDFAALELVGDGFDPALVAGISATGTIVTSATPIDGLHPHLNAQLTAAAPDVIDDKSEQALRWLTRSELQRRAALKHHAGAFRLQPHWPLASVLMVTNRASMLSHAVSQIIEQTYPNVEVIVGLHGINAEEGHRLLQNHVDLLGERIRLVSLDSSIPLGLAYGQLTGMTNGEYIAKFDDDDFYGPHHLWDAIMSLKYSGAGLFGRTPSMTWLSATDELLLRPFGIEETYNKYIIGPTMVMSKAALIEVGGWRPTPWAVDKALIDRFMSAGAGMYRAGQLGWVYVRHNQGHTWVRDESAFREQAVASWTGDKALELRTLVLQNESWQS